MQANNKTRSLSHELFSPTLKQFGLNASIKEYVQNIEKLNPELITTFQTEEVRFDMQLEINIFRIVQELLSNTLKYANASKIEIMLQKQNNKLLFSYSDNGIGFNDEIIKKGVGLKSITDRILRFKGESSIVSQENKGFTFTCSIPL
jgi:signal transduction histidine kinase